jgi:hypothetical protein
MALFHLSVKAISRSAGRSATAAAAYRAGEKILDERTDELHDYTRKGGVESADLVIPEGAPEWASDRAKLWNAAELAEKRKDACVAREYEVALPAELNPAQQRALALDFAHDMANREGCAVDVAIHAPGRGGDNRNHHAHILRTTRKVEMDGLGAKLDTEKAGRKRADDLEAVRARWAELTNMHLERAGVAERVDHRSLKEQGIEREPTQHLGPAATGYERRTGEPSDNRIRQEQQAAERSAQVELGQLERQGDAAADAIESIKAEMESTLVKHVEDRFKALREARLKAERDQAERDQVQKAQAEQKRIERMSAAELRAEINRLRPSPQHEVVERQSEVAQALRQAQGLAKEALQKRSEAAQALREGREWREAHPLRAKAHDAGLLRSKVLRETEQRRKDAQTDWQQLTLRVKAAEAQTERARSNAGQLVAWEQAPALAKVAKLERIERGKQVKERAERARMQEASKLLSEVRIHALKREMKADGYADTGKHWKALAEPVRHLVEKLNELPKNDRPSVLEAIRDQMARSPERLEKFAKSVAESRGQDRGQSKKQDRGMSR